MGRLWRLVPNDIPSFLAAAALLYYYGGQAVNDLTAELKGRVK